MDPIGSNARNINELAKLADNIWEVSNHSEVHAVAVTSSDVNNVAIQNLLTSKALICEGLNKLTLETNSFKVQKSQHNIRQIDVDLDHVVTPYPEITLTGCTSIIINLGATVCFLQEQDAVTLRRSIVEATNNGVFECSTSRLFTFYIKGLF